MSSSEEPDRQGDDEEAAWDADDLERASENVLGAWPSARVEDPPPEATQADALDGASAPQPEPERSETSGAEGRVDTLPEEAPGEEAPREEVSEESKEDVEERDGVHESTGEHAPGELAVPPGYPVLEGEARGGRRAVGIVVRPRSDRICEPMPYSRGSALKPSSRFASTVSSPCSCSS